ncbi:GPI inositol deacylase [Agyrium rufum]|nr:GPI inositol deacylase [Agyrium rufum]
MRTRPSGSSDEDETQHELAEHQLRGDSIGKVDIQLLSAVAENAGSKRTSTSIENPDLARHSFTLDRRKSDKLPNPTSQNEAGGGAGKRIATAGVTAIEGEKHTLTGAIKSSAREGSVGTMNDIRDYRRWRVRNLWRSSSLVWLVTGLAICSLYAIVTSFISRQRDPEGCKQCWMIPAYAKLSGFDTEHTRFASKYSLYLYREIGVDEDTMVKGVPVLFIPGNAGSYKQVRPIAAEAAYYFRDHIQSNADMINAGTRNLDFFSVDFNEDITAWHGQTLLDQAEYLNEAVAYILSLYHDPRRSRRDPGLPDPSSVIIVGHSMGGIVARTMLVLPNYQSNSINTIITMSAPHARAPVSFDADIVHTYSRINDYWRRAYSQKWASDNPLWHVTLISIAGGGLDTIVPSDYASVSSLVPETHGFTVFTSSIPDVWTGSDHLSILWCDQFRKVVVKALVDTVDVRRPSQTKQRAERMRIFRKRFLTGMESFTEKNLLHAQPTTLLTLEDNSNSMLALGERLVMREFGQSGVPKAYLLPVPPPGTPGKKSFTLLTDQALGESAQGRSLDVLVCSVFPLQSGQSAAVFAMNMDLSGASTGSTRLACKSAASDVTTLPASSRTSKFAFDDASPFSYLEYALTDLAEHQFVAIVDKLTHPSPGWLIAEYSDHGDSKISNKLGLGHVMASGVHMLLPASRPMVTEIKIPSLQSSMFAYRLRLGSQACGDTELFTPLLRQHISDPYESKYFVNVKEANINFHGFAPFMPPALRSHHGYDGLALQLWTDPTCKTSIDFSLEFDLTGSLGKLVMRYRTLFAAFPLVIVALVLRKQFLLHDETGVFITFGDALDRCLRSSIPILLLTISFLAMTLITPDQPSPTARSFWHGQSNETLSYYSKRNLLLGSQDSFFWLLIPLFGLICIGVCVLVNYAALAIIHFLYIGWTTLSAKPAWLRNDDRRRQTRPAFTEVSPRRRLITTAFLLIMVSTFIPYQFAYMVACIVQIATCTRALRVAKETSAIPYFATLRIEDRELTPFLPQQSLAYYDFYNYAHSLLILMLWILPINLPVLVVWIHNLAVHWLTPFSSHHNVLSIMPIILLVETSTGGRMIPRVSSSIRYITSLLFMLLAILAAIYGVTYAYWLHHLTNVVCAWLVAVHFAGSGFSLSGLRQILDGSTTPAIAGSPVLASRDGKKRP